MRVVWLNRVLLLVCLLVCATPLFVGLDQWEMRNDEEIYSYAVERMLDTGDWLTPRYIPEDLEFLEKPPLKFWLVAGLIHVGLAPRSDAGMRILDPIFGTILFAYVFLFSTRFAGPIAGAVAVLVLGTHYSLVFEHGLRSNNMDAALSLAYAGGLWHAARWSEAGPPRSGHAWAATGYFVLGFMTKYVAAVFLPIVAIAAWLWHPAGARAVLSRWREWVFPGLAAVLAIAPWFIYQASQHGWEFWNILIGGQVLQRFTTGVDPSHLAPWHFYFTRTWQEFRQAGSLWLVVPGLALLVWRAVRGYDATARLALLWWLMPVALISLGSSKLAHYIYPFLAPLAIAAGAFASALWDRCRTAARRLHAAVSGRPVGRLARVLGRRPRAVFAATAGLVALSIWTNWFGPVELNVGGVRLFRNSSTWRPLIGAGLLLLAGRHVSLLIQTSAAALLIAALPWRAYTLQRQIATMPSRPLSTLAQCVADEGRPGVYVVEPTGIAHSYFYNLRHAGAWTTSGDDLEETRRRILSNDIRDQTPVLMTRKTWREYRIALGLPPMPPPGEPSRFPFDNGLQFGNADVLLVPPRFSRCLDAAIDRGNGDRLSPDDPAGDSRP